MTYLTLCLAAVVLIAQLELSVACRDGWTGHAGSCYKFSDGALPMIEAHSMCKTIGGHLVEIERNDEAMFLSAQVNGRPGNNSYWIGMTDELMEGQWHWINSGNDVTLFFWAPGQPDNANYVENCAAFNENGEWEDLPCSTRSVLYLCEYTPM